MVELYPYQKEILKSLLDTNLSDLEERLMSNPMYQRILEEERIDRLLGLR